MEGKKKKKNELLRRVFGAEGQGLETKFHFIKNVWLLNCLLHAVCGAGEICLY